MFEHKFKIKGMHCHSCALLIEDELKNLPGIVDAQVDFKKAELSVLVNGQIDEERIAGAISSLGDYRLIF